MKVNDVIHGFRLIREEKISEVNGTAREFTHEKTGARLVYISNKDNNKVFHIGFKTPSENSTGVAHILEHSVLCGSEKYPLKEPFVELAKGSLNTFLNAMTYPDKTVYPIASTNDKDFSNLMDVYLDAVFNPSIYTMREIFMQEGWHYHIESPEDPITYNGVVYNEMKGVYSSPDEFLTLELFKALYPDSIYGGESGGFPDDIPTLSYEAFLDFHRTFYHPSNAYIYLYGDGDVEKHLAALNDGYLCHYDRQTVDSEIENQKRFDKTVMAESVYPIVEGEDQNEKDYLAYGYMLSENASYTELLGMDILTNILMENNSSPLKKALLDLDVAQDIDFMYHTSMQQPCFALIFKNTDKKYKALIEKTINDTLMQLAKDGLDPQAIKAGINSAEFTLKEGEFGTYPRGLVYGLEMMDTWLYGKDPFTPLQYTSAIEALRSGSEKGYFEALMRKCLSDNAHRALVVITPDDQYALKHETATRQKLAALKEKLDQKELAALIASTQALIMHQNAEDSPEALATIPKLSLDEIDKKARQLVIFEEKIDDHKLLWHPGETNGIAYIRLIFDLHAIDQKDLPYISILNKLLCRLGTAHYSDEALNQEIQIYTGGISSSIETIDKVKPQNEYEAFFNVKGKAVTANLKKLGELMSEVMLLTQFDDKKLIRDILNELIIEKKQAFLMSGNAASVHRLQAYYSQSGRLFEQINGIDFYDFLVDLEKGFDQTVDDLCNQLQKQAKQLFNQNSVIVSLTCEEKDKAEALSVISGMLQQLPSEVCLKNTFNFDFDASNEGFKTSAKIQYVSQGCNIRDCGFEYDGGMLVLRKILGMDYLWNRVRVQGGAYGASFNINSSGELSFSSFRDPNLVDTLKVYNDTADYIAALDISDRELEKYIIGTISGKDTPLSPAVLGNVADTMYFKGLTQGDLQRERDEILSVSLEKIRSYAQMLRFAVIQDHICVIGSEEAVEAARDCFDEIKQLQ